MIKISPAVKQVYPTAKFGVMTATGLSATAGQAVLRDIVAAEIEAIKRRYPDYDRKTAVATEPICHYAAYYKKYKKSYPVLGQLESVVLKDKGIPPVGVPVEAMFLAEVKNMLLTAGHDLDCITGDLTVDIATLPLGYTGISQHEQTLVEHDLYLRDEKGGVSSILQGPDCRTRLTEGTQRALYFVYGVEGVGEQRIREHLNTIASYLQQANPAVEIESLEVF